jgi:2-C-methyl-D-erythritol 4-phosphate cytidylyltransferase/2-C-methyl-D-erythritol 2,4-cyclodiphosphate synthase
MKFMNTVILLAAGLSKRAKTDKLWVDFWGRPLWTLSYHTFRSHPQIDKIILVVRSGEENRFREVLNAFSDFKTEIITGGSARMDSFKAGISALRKSSEISESHIILDHNAANPNVTNQEITEVIAAAKTYGAAAVSMPCVDTVMEAHEEFYFRQLERSFLRLMQTPQGVRGDILYLALAQTFEGTDLSTALLPFTPVKLIEASPQNRKITFKEDLDFFMQKTAFGEDSHKFSATVPSDSTLSAHAGCLVLGGLKIESLPAMEANSDGDTILHALCRALAQIKGQNFSTVADKFVERGIRDSKEIIKPFLEGIKIECVAIHIEAQKPHIDDLPLARSLSEILGISEDKIHISAMSGEGLTSFGRGEGIYCKCLIHYL